MSRSWFVLRSLIHYRGVNLTVVAGGGVAVAVLAGALLVGGSVRGSLRDLALGRLGLTDTVVTTPVFFRDALADDLLATPAVAGEFDGAAPLITLNGFVTEPASGRRATGSRSTASMNGSGRFIGARRRRHRVATSCCSARRWHARWRSSRVPRSSSGWSVRPTCRSGRCTAGGTMSVGRFG